MDRILLIEDDPIARGALEEILRASGFETRSAGTAAASLEVAATFAPDFLVVDLNLEAEGDGLEAARQLHAQRPGLAIVVQTGFPADTVAEALGDLPVLKVFSKPLAIEDLLALLRSAGEDVAASGAERSG